MSDLSNRAEQAVLGALIADRARVRDVTTLGVPDFADRRHQVIFTALTGAAGHDGGVLGKLRGFLARLPLRKQIRELDAYMVELPGLCPDPDHLASYVQMLTQARQQRDATAQQQAETQAAADADAAERLDGAARWLAREAEKTAEQARRLRRHGHPRPDGDGLPRDVAQLAKALRVPPPQPARQAQAQPLPPATARTADGAASPALNGSSPAVPPAGPDAHTPKLNGENLQELVLADLLQRPAGGREVVRWLSAEVFTPGPRRHLYELISARIDARQPADPLIIAWDAAHAGESGPQLASPDYALRVGALAVVPGTAATIGRGLLASHLYTQRFGADWPRSPQLTQPATEPPPQHDPAAEPPPEPAPGPQPEAAGHAVPSRLVPAAAFVQAPPAQPVPGGVTPRM
jgi:hypothetical protein